MHRAWRALPPLGVRFQSNPIAWHEKIREDPSASEKKAFTPDKSFKRKVKKTLAERKADVQTKKDAKNAELEEDDDE